MQIVKIVIAMATLLLTVEVFANVAVQNAALNANLIDQQ